MASAPGVVQFRVPQTFRAAAVEARKVLRDPRLLLWSLFMMLFPFYVFPSGLPQPADWLLLLLLPMVLNGRRRYMSADLMRPFRALLIFTGYALLVNAAWSIALLTFTTNARDGFLLSPIFYMYNGLMFLAFMLMYERYGYRLLWLTARLALVSVSFQVVLSFIARGRAGRATLMFNNPNQLGYFALLCACILLVGQKKLRMSTLQITAGLAAASYLALTSASKAALGSIAMLGIALLLTRVRTILLATATLAVLAFTSNPFSDAMEKAEQRIEKDKSTGFLEDRGYDRVVNNPEYWLFGSGEGGYRRFAATTKIGSHELHSSAATLFFCYGIIGTLMFGAFLWLSLRGSEMRVWIVVLPGFVYGMTHQGLRFTLLWIMLGMASALRDLSRRSATQGASAQVGPTQRSAAGNAAASSRPVVAQLPAP